MAFLSARSEEENTELETKIGAISIEPDSGRSIVSDIISPSSTPMITTRSYFSATSGSIYEDALDYVEVVKCPEDDVGDESSLVVPPLDLRSEGECPTTRTSDGTIDSNVSKSTVSPSMSATILPIGPSGISSPSGASGPSGISDISGPSTASTSVPSTATTSVSFTALLSAQSNVTMKKVSKEKDEAFQIWLNGKKKLDAVAVVSKKKQEEETRQRALERKNLSDRKVGEWAVLKARQEQMSRQAQSRTDSLSSMSLPISVNSSVLNSVRSEPSEEKKAKMEEWARKKKIMEEQRRRVERKKEERLRQMEEERQKLADQAYQRWSATAHKKPKPVPLNRGIDSLRGTVSPIFINPNEWKSILDDDKDEPLPKTMPSLKKKTNH